MAVYIEDMDIPMSGHILIVFPSRRVVEVSADSTQVIFREKQALPVPPHGRWNNTIQGIIPSGQCSNCGAWDKVTRFCPNCGSYMRKEN